MSIKDTLNKRSMVIVYMIGIGVLLRLFVLFTPRDFWHDEAFQYLYSLKPVSFIIAGNDVHPPLFTLLSKLFINAGMDNIFLLRELQIVWAMVFIAVFCWLMWDLFGKHAAILSTLAVAIVPTYVYYGTEFRNYSFTLMLVILQILYFNKLLKKDKPSTSLVFALLSTAMIYSHYLSGLILFVQVIYLIVRWKKKNLRFIFPMMFTAILSIPLIIYTWLLVQNIHSFWFKNITIVSFISTFLYIIIPPTTTPTGISLVIYGVIIFGVIKYRKRLDARHLQFGMYAVLPILTMWVISQFMPFYHHRYFLFGSIGIFALFGWAATAISNRRRIVYDFMMAALIITVFFSYSFFIATFNTELMDSSAALYNVTNNATDDFITVHYNTFSQSPIKAYFPGHRAYLISNLSRKELFTAGGSVVGEDEKYPNLSEIVYENANKDIYIYDTMPAADGIVIFKEGGLYVTKIS